MKRFCTAILSSGKLILLFLATGPVAVAYGSFILGGELSPWFMIPALAASGSLFSYLESGCVEPPLKASTWYLVAAMIGYQSSWRVGAAMAGFGTGFLLMFLLFDRMMERYPDKGSTPLPHGRPDSPA